MYTIYFTQLPPSSVDDIIDKFDLYLQHNYNQYLDDLSDDDDSVQYIEEELQKFLMITFRANRATNPETVDEDIITFESLSDYNMFVLRYS